MSQITIYDNEIAPLPGQATNCPGVALGVTRPYNKPWDIKPAKPPETPKE